MEGRKAVDILSVVAISGAVRPTDIELVCSTVCNACREGSDNYSIVVNSRNKNRHLLLRKGQQLIEVKTAAALGAAGNAESNCTHRQPQSTISEDGVNPSPAASASRITPHRRIRQLAFHLQHLPLAQVTWPDCLQVLKFGWEFSYPLDQPLPTSLLEIDLGGLFNHHIEEVAWPPRLLKLHFGDRFNRPIELVTWPTTLRSLSFGSSFDQRIEAVDWPQDLEDLFLGDAFNHPIRLVDWGSSATNLKRLAFGSAFRQEVDEVRWPARLEELAFGACFDKPLDMKEIPRSLKLLRLPDLYDGGGADGFDGGEDDLRRRLAEGLPDECELHIQEIVLRDDFLDNVACL